MRGDTEKPINAKKSFPKRRTCCIQNGAVYSPKMPSSLLFSVFESKGITMKLLTPASFAWTTSCCDDSFNISRIGVFRPCGSARTSLVRCIPPAGGTSPPATRRLTRFYLITCKAPAPSPTSPMLSKPSCRKRFLVIRRTVELLAAMRTCIC